MNFQILVDINILSSYAEPLHNQFTMLREVFMNLSPFRTTILSLLPPFEISKLLAALSCDLTPAEWKLHMNLLDDIFEDTTPIILMKRLGMTVRVFGADLKLLEERVRDPCGYLKENRHDRALNVFVLVTDVSSKTDPIATLVRDYRPTVEHDYVPNQLTLRELQTAFKSPVSLELTTLYDWILCAPCLSGTMSDAIPGWIPIFKSRSNIDVRAYISTYNASNGRILHMNRVYMRQVFGFSDNCSLLSSLGKLSTMCYKIEGEKENIQHLEGKWTMDALHDVFAAAQNTRDTSEDKYVVMNTVHPLNTSITLTLD